MPSFENLHPNKFFAFLDGFLCALIFAFIAHRVRADKLETDARNEGFDRGYARGVQQGEHNVRFGYPKPQTPDND